MRRIILVHNNLIHQIARLVDETILDNKFLIIFQKHDSDLERRKEYEAYVEQYFSVREDPYARIHKKEMSKEQLELFQSNEKEALQKSINIARFETTYCNSDWMYDLPSETRIILKLDNIQKHFSESTTDELMIVNPENTVRQIKNARRNARGKAKVQQQRRIAMKNFREKSLTAKQCATSILKTATSVKTHYDGKSKEPNDKAENQTFLAAWKRQWLGKRPQRIVGRWIARAEIPHSNETVLQGSWRYKADRVYYIIKKNLDMHMNDLFEMVANPDHMLRQIDDVLVEKICDTLRHRIENGKITHEQFHRKFELQLQGNKSLKTKMLLGKKINPFQISMAQQTRDKFLQQSIDRHNTEQPEVKSNSEKTKYARNGVKKPNDIFTKVKPRSVSYYRKNRDKLEQAIQKGYLGTRRVKFLKELIFMNSVLCDEIRESSSAVYLAYRTEEELELKDLTATCYNKKGPYLLTQLTEIFDEVAEILFEEDYHKYETETEKLIAMDTYWSKRIDIHGQFMAHKAQTRMLQNMNQIQLLKEHENAEFLRDDDFRSWKHYMNVRTKVIATTEFIETKNYQVWEEHEWRSEAIGRMTIPTKRLGKLRIQKTKYDHKGKEPNDRVIGSHPILIILVFLLCSFLQPVEPFKILQPNQHISSDFKSGNVALCEMTPGSETHANMNDSKLHKITVNDWTVINAITKRHIFAIPITRAREDMTFDLMEPGIGMSVECYNGFRIFSSYGTIQNKSILITNPQQSVMSLFVTSSSIPYNLTYEFATPDGIYRNTEEIVTRKQYLQKHESISKIAILTKVKKKSKGVKRIGESVK